MTTVYEGNSLMSLERFNQERSKWYEDMQKPKPNNGIACPVCGKELVDSVYIAIGFPPKRSTFCNNCSFTGWRVA